MSKHNIAMIVLSVIAMVIVIGACLIMGVLPITGNRSLIDTVYNFDSAIIALPNGEVIEGSVDSWHDYEGDQIQVTIDGVTYLCHMEDVTLICSK